MSPMRPPLLFHDRADPYRVLADTAVKAILGADIAEFDDASGVHFGAEICRCEQIGRKWEREMWK